MRFFYGARTEDDLFGLEEIERLGSALGDFRFTPVVERFVHEAVGEYLTAGEITAPDVYMCGPPPMIEAAEAMLTGAHEIDEARIFSDKFTTSADAAPDSAQPGPPVKRVDSAAAPAGSDAERDFDWYTPRKRRASLYEDVTIDTQPSIHRHLTRGWPMFFEDGRGTWDDGSTQLRSSDWYAFRDPAEQWERTYYQRCRGGREPDRERDALGRSGRLDRRLHARLGRPSSRRISRLRPTSSTACGSRWPRSGATACPIPSPPACVYRRR